MSKLSERIHFSRYCWLAGCHGWEFPGHVLHANGLAPFAAGYNPVVEFHARLAVPQLTHLKRGGSLLRHVQFSAIPARSKEDVISPVRIHGLKKDGIERNGGDPAFELTGAEVLKPGTTRTQLADLSDNVESLKAELEQARAVLCEIQDQLRPATTASAAPQASAAPEDR